MFGSRLGAMHHLHGAASTTRGRRIVGWIAGVLAFLTVVGMIVLWPTGDARTRARKLGLPSEVYAAHVIRAERGPCTGTTDTDRVICQQVRFRLDQGPDEGESRRLEFPRSASTPRFEVGDDVVLARFRNADAGFDYQFSDRQRRSSLVWLLLLFAFAVVALGRLRGLAALVGLGASIAVVLVFVLPALLEGESPVLIAVVGSSAIAYLALYLAHGVRTLTSVALLGTLVALGLTVALASVFTELTQLSGFASEESFLVQIGTTGVDMRGLVLAGMVLGALGALDDVTVTQASAVWELREANPAMPRGALYGAGLRIGRDHVASTVNTLALAYAGASLPLLIIFVLSRQSLGTIANSEVIATEIVRTLVGSIGLVSAVPVTTWLAARLVADPPAEPDDGDSDGGDDGAPEATDAAAAEPAAFEEAPAAVSGTIEDQFWRRK